MRIVQVTAVALGGAAAVAVLSLWQAAERLGGTVEWLGSRQPPVSPQPSASHTPAAPAMQRNGNAAANVRSATSNTSSASEAELLERLENASPATAVTDPELEATLRALLEDPDPEVRQGAVELLEFWLSQSPEPGATR